MEEDEDALLRTTGTLVVDAFLIDCDEAQGSFHMQEVTMDGGLGTSLKHIYTGLTKCSHLFMASVLLCRSPVHHYIHVYCPVSIWLKKYTRIDL